MILFGITGTIFGQVLHFDDSTFASVPFGENFQSIDIEYSTEKDSFFLYTTFDLVTHARVNVYRTTSFLAPANLRLARVFTLPYQYRHPNSIQIIGDSILVCGTGNDGLSTIAMFNKFNGQLFNEMIDTLPKNAILRSTFFHRGDIYRLVSESLKIDLQWFRNGQFSTVRTLTPSPMRDIYNYIQGTIVLFDRFLVVLTSFPTRLDFYDLKNDLRYSGQYFGEYGGLESEGIAQFSRYDTAFVYYGLRFPNKINVLRFPKNPSPPSLLFPEYGAVISATTASYGWSIVKGVFHYDINIASDALFQSPVLEENGVLNPHFLAQLPKNGIYYWRIRSSNIINNSRWSTPSTMRVDVVSNASHMSNSVFPQETEIFPPHPNPFNSTSVVKISLANESNVSISLYDITGRFIKDVVRQTMQRGIHAVPVNGDDLAAGIYLGRVAADDKIQFIKFTLIK